MKDFQEILVAPSAEAQVVATTKIAQAWREGRMEKTALREAERLFETIVTRASVTVRAALSESLKDCGALPRDLALRLARDVDIVSMPVLQASTVLSDEDLIALVAEVTSHGQAAIARRTPVSVDVSEALVQNGDETAVATLVDNPGAQISEKTLQTVVDKHAKNDLVAGPLTSRQNLPARVVDRLLHVVSEHLKSHLATQKNISPDMVGDLVLQSRERATIGIMDETGLDVDTLVSSLYEHGRLTSTLIIRALLSGDYLFFETALAKRAAILPSNAHSLVRDPGEQGLMRLLHAAGMPTAHLGLIRVAMAAAKDVELGAGDDARERYRKVVMERILTGFGDMVDTVSLDYMITKISEVT